MCALAHIYTRQRTVYISTRREPWVRAHAYPPAYYLYKYPAGPGTPGRGGKICCHYHVMLAFRIFSPHGCEPSCPGRSPAQRNMRISSPPPLPCACAIPCTRMRTTAPLPFVMVLQAREWRGGNRQRALVPVGTRASRPARSARSPARAPRCPAHPAPRAGRPARVRPRGRGLVTHPPRGRGRPRGKGGRRRGEKGPPYVCCA